jgi:hypothetical protein
MYATFSIISATISSLLAFVIPLAGAVARYTYIANFRERVESLFKSRTEEADTRNLSTSSNKSRTVTINPGNTKVTD